MEKKSNPYGKIITVLTAISFIVTIVLYPRLPAAIPYHWNLNGSVNTAGKWIAFITALMPVVVYFISVAYPKKNQSNPEIVSFFVCVLLIAVHWIVLFLAMR